MLIRLILFECYYYFRQVSFIVAAIVFFVMGIIAPRGGYGGDEVYKNSPYAITTIICLLSLLLVFVITLFVANVILRDSEHKMEGLIYTTSLTRFHYITGRFSGLIAVTFLILCLSVLGMLIGILFLKSTQVGPFHIAYYLLPLIQFGIPNILFSAALIFSVALLTRSPIATYSAGLGIYILYMIASILGNSPLMASSVLKNTQNDLLPILSDPYGLVAFFGKTRFWSSTERNTQLIPLEGPFLLNRIFWIVLSFILFTGIYQLVSFRILVTKQKKYKYTKETHYKPTPYTIVLANTQLYSTQSRMFVAQIKLMVRQMFNNIYFIVMLLMWAFFMSIEISETISNGAFGISFYPTTGLIVGVISETKPVILILLFYSMELLWHERTIRIDSLIDTTPVYSFVLFLSKSLIMAILVCILIILPIVIGIGFQLANGYYEVEFPLYLSLLYYNGVPLILMAILMLSIQILVANKYLGMLLAAFFISLLLSSERLGIEHYLVRYAKTPTLIYSAINGFGQYTQSFHWYMGYWCACAGILSLFTFGLWTRGEQKSLAIRFSQLRYQWGKTGSWIVLAFMIIFLVCGSYIFYQTNGIQTYLSSEEIVDRKADYEKKYKVQASLPQPTITDVKTEVDLYTEVGKYQVRGHYKLQNKTAAPITKILVWVDFQVNSIELSIPNAILIKKDTHFHHYWFQLKVPLLPNEQTDMQFTLKVIRSGFVDFNNENSVVHNGTYIELEKYLPLFGYAQHTELDDPIERTERGLSEKKTVIVSESEQFNRYDWVHYQTVVSTSVKQQVVTVGDLRKEWLKNGRRYFYYRADKPIAFAFAISSANYEQIKETYKGTEIKLYYQTGQNYNIASMLQSVKHSLDYYSKAFGTYQYKQIKIAEIPQYRGAATAYPGTIFMAETYNFLSDYRNPDKLDYTYVTLAHEVAHEWWAHQLEPANVPGHKVLTETLAEYSEALILEKRYGKNRLRSYREKILDLYLAARGFASDVESPLYQANSDQMHVYYYKGALGMWALKELIGEKAVNLALSSLLRTYAFPNRQASTQDLLKELYKVTPVALHKPIDDWFKKIIFYDLSIEYATYKRMADGRYKVDIKVNTQKTESFNRTERVIKSNESFEIGIFSKHPDEVHENKDILYLRPHLFTQKTPHLSIIVEEEPVSVIIDPYTIYIDKNRFDNLKILSQEE